MVTDFSYNDHKLRRLFAELDVAQRKKALKGAFRKEANRVRKAAVQNLRASGIRTDHDLEKGIRAVVFKNIAGFRVTIGSKKANKHGRGERGMHLTRAGLKKPILVWAEGGTSERWNRPEKKKNRWWTTRKKKRYTGRMPKYGFMAKTLNQAEGSTTAALREEIHDNIVRTARKYGCE